ncbi:MAG: sigma-54-dependent transcriptional regulator [Woeseiaceae bacterium]
MPRLLIIDDNEGVCSALSMLFRLHDLEVVTASSPEEGLEVLEHQDVHLVVQDMNFSLDTTSGEEGIALFGKIRSLFPDTPIILLTAWTHLEQAVELVKGGASDYMSKPWDDDRLVTTVNNLLQLRAAQNKNAENTQNFAKERDQLEAFDLCGMVFESRAILSLLHTATQVARANVPVLISGPNGVGKELFADVVHANSGREGPLVKVNAGALPPDLIESELFGSEEGAFTGAQQRQGRFELADGGTLFLDEIGNLPPEGQMKLLRVLQTGEFERLGSSKTKQVDVRLITATNSDLTNAIAESEFRQDLYYRINLIEISVPSLNQRSDDILPLAEHFLSSEHSLSPDARRALLEYHWPGNVREVQNCIRRAELLGDDNTITASHLNLQMPKLLAEGEPSAEEIQKALDTYGHVVARAARSLGLSRQALYRRMAKFGLD